MSEGWRPPQQSVYYFFVTSVGHVHGWLWCSGSGARDAGVGGDQHFWQRRPTWERRGMCTMKQHQSGPFNSIDVMCSSLRAVPFSVEIRSCLNGDAGTNVQHRRQKVSPVWFPSFSSFERVSSLWLCRPLQELQGPFQQRVLLLWHSQVLKWRTRHQD